MVGEVIGITKLIRIHPLGTTSLLHFTTADLIVVKTAQKRQKYLPDGGAR